MRLELSVRPSIDFVVASPRLESVGKFFLSSAPPSVQPCLVSSSRFYSTDDEVLPPLPYLQRRPAACRAVQLLQLQLVPGTAAGGETSAAGQEHKTTYCFSQSIDGDTYWTAAAGGRRPSEERRRSVAQANGGLPRTGFPSS